MKIDRVILSSNYNYTYCHFWNPIARVYRDKFGIEPTLVWLGTEEQMQEVGIDTSLGDVIIQPYHPEYQVGWQSTWALFWATQFYRGETCTIMGIDQLPLSPMFFRDLIKDVNPDAYCMLIADAYRPNHWTVDKSASPSSYHIAKGSTFDKVHKFERDFMREVEKLYNSGVHGFWDEGESRWGIDESWSSINLRNSKDVDIVSLDNFSLLCQRRIECERHKETPYDITRLQEGWYSEAHLCRPYTNHKNYIDTLIDNIPVFK